ncbi:hypothetical protein CRP01_30625 [Flavilitoribacter nigricans DSM 23189 = NBRC 102662]|uniref:Uncharacterized protein n=1 Tax=Flavilitoribacter nigricans (strain ATCC 23147 / DSM 23189 / NBRC 102662 / NCIMB 1420 / SS-2) TaxID=1122177 RepID=A0A2D0N2I6_FLAN2|nr:hypothetical protein CRP01_30625 [Flavilitoribacter nigricans DSM 23189 = NBRC 102662]
MIIGDKAFLIGQMVKWLVWFRPAFPFPVQIRWRQPDLYPADRAKIDSVYPSINATLPPPAFTKVGKRFLEI